MEKLFYKNYAESLYEALKEDPFYVAMENSVSNKNKARKSMIKYHYYSMVEAEKYGELVLSNNHHYGAAIWSKPVDYNILKAKSKEKKSFLLNEMGKESMESYKKITEFMSEKASSIIGDDFWYLSILGVLPQYQGKGLGVELVKPILEKTDNLGVPTYLETFTPRNITFYSRLGYREVAVFTEPTTNTEYLIMVRE